jgi:hypothetical protein
LKCIKCTSRNVYFQDGQYACMMCGTRFYMASVKPIIIKKAEDEEMAVREYKNCGRIKTIVMKGMCGGCNGVVYRKYNEGTLEVDTSTTITHPEHDPIKLPKGKYVVKVQKEATGKNTHASVKD